MKKNIFNVLFCFCLFTNLLFAQQAGDLDATFGVGGVITTDIRVHPVGGDYLTDMVIQQDGKIVAISI